MARGKFIVFEGGPGAGKDTMIEFLKKNVGERDDVVFTREPGGTPLGERIREILLSKDTKGIDAKAEFLLFLAARAELIEKVIAPALKEGKTVVSNRFALSSIAYQIYGRERPDLYPLAKVAIQAIVGRNTPDLLIYLDAPPEVGVKRALSRKGEPHRFITEEEAFYGRVRAGYKKHLREFAKKAVAIDSNRSADETWKDVENALESYL